VTEQLTTDDARYDAAADAARAAQEVARLLDQVKPTLPVLLANLTTVGQSAVTYKRLLEQLLSCCRRSRRGSGALPGQQPTGIAVGCEFRLSMGDPPGCTVGYLPPSSWRSPADTTTIDTPEGLYWQAPAGLTDWRRGARTIPAWATGERAADRQMCDATSRSEPVAERQQYRPLPTDPT